MVKKFVKIFRGKISYKRIDKYSNTKLEELNSIIEWKFSNENSKKDKNSTEAS